MVLKSLILLQSKENCSRIASFPEIKQIDQIAAEGGTPLHWVSIGWKDYPALFLGNKNRPENVEGRLSEGILNKD